MKEEQLRNEDMIKAAQQSTKHAPVLSGDEVRHYATCCVTTEDAIRAAEQKVLERALTQRPAAREVDWRTPTTYAQRFTDAVALLCREAPPADMVVGWLDLHGIGADDHRLQDWACERAPAWAQGIGLLDAAHVMASQPTEGVDHEPAPQQATPEPVEEPVVWRWRNANGDAMTAWLPYKPDQRTYNEQQVGEVNGTVEYAYTRPAPGVPEDVHTGDELPPAGKFVIAWIEGMKVPLRAMWVPDFHLPANEDAAPDWAKYSEEQDAYFAPAGWYECNHSDETNWQIHERVLAWSHLPVIDRAMLAAAQAKGGV